METKLVSADQDHMEEINILSEKAIACLKGLSAMSFQIVKRGNFKAFTAFDLIFLADQCKEFTDKIADIAAEAHDCYEELWQADKARLEAQLSRPGKC